MEEKLQIVLQEYIKDVEEVCKILLRSINDSESLNLRNKYDFFMYRSSCRKMEFEAGGIIYRLRNTGCVAFNENMFIVWNFGYRSRWCGIDPWKVSWTLRENNSPYVEYYDGDLIKAACEQFVKKGIMFKRNDKYYFEIIKDETFKPEFPTEYDTLIIEYFNLSWSMQRNKIIDRFIRKSTRIHNQIIKKEDKCILKFLLDGKEIYTIPYDDISYPENAIKIMSDQVIKNLKKTVHQIEYSQQMRREVNKMKCKGFNLYEILNLWRQSSLYFLSKLSILRCIFCALQHFYVAFFAVHDILNTQ